MTQDNWTDRLSEYLDGTLAVGERAALEAHLGDCAACAATLEELRRVVARARALDDRAPGADLWPKIAVGIGRATAPRARRSFAFTVPQLIAASVALIILSGGTTWLLRSRAVTATPVAMAPPQAQWLTAADRRYETTVAELQGALVEGRRTGRLDSTTVRILERNLATIDTRSRRRGARSPRTRAAHISTITSPTRCGGSWNCSARRPPSPARTAEEESCMITILAV